MASNANSAVNPAGPKTSSRCVTESSTGTHDFELPNYRLLDGMGVGNYVSSATFGIGGYNWAIIFYPDGGNNDCAGYASAHIKCLNPTDEVRTKSTINMLHQDGEKQVQLTDCDEGAGDVYSPAKLRWGYTKFVEKSKMKSVTQSGSGSLIIRCVLTVIVKHSTEVTRKTNLVVVPGPDLQGHLRQMWKDEQGADVTFSVGGQLFSAHRCLLAARSPVFKAELFGPMKEKSIQPVKIDDIEPLVFEALLHFVYTDSMQDDEHNKESSTAELQHLLVAADRYGLDRLRVLCESKLCEGIDVKTVATTLALAERHHYKDLKEACLEFMVPRNVLRAVMATDGFKHLLASCPWVMIEILDKTCLH
ncbi:BTB/POZ and MATH domain-containing protein 2 [Brachypodium distachyon]|uniref:BTB/POZ and MATH domain-containing protein 2 n=1 Tax=Brachypodium distachyon TaxID=15368 RepID=UPI00052FFF2A|nr:BTB/POZ and MATH domain-containing protein 2 [Brachypodium distachyon]|eukprot:XP_010227275.1 BTB/POZ and MATH domain-containing protein 2 [Brachypodium distachyon]